MQLFHVRMLDKCKATYRLKTASQWQWREMSPREREELLNQTAKLKRGQMDMNTIKEAGFRKLL